MESIRGSTSNLLCSAVLTSSPNVVQIKLFRARPTGWKWEAKRFLEKLKLTRELFRSEIKCCRHSRACRLTRQFWLNISHISSTKAPCGACLELEEAWEWLRIGKEAKRESRKLSQPFFCQLITTSSDLRRLAEWTTFCPDRLSTANQTRPFSCCSLVSGRNRAKELFR